MMSATVVAEHLGWHMGPISTVVMSMTLMPFSGPSFTPDLRGPRLRPAISVQLRAAAARAQGRPGYGRHARRGACYFFGRDFADLQEPVELVVLCG